ncbi:hypothetical protein NBRC116587_37070 [Pseudoteredinibacter isoporae]
MIKQQLSGKETRMEGKWRFVLIRGVLFWGGTMFIAMAFIKKPFAGGFFTAQAITHCVVWPLLGLLYGMLCWRFSEKPYQNALNESDRESA